MAGICLSLIAPVVIFHLHSHMTKFDLLLALSTLMISVHFMQGCVSICRMMQGWPPFKPSSLRTGRLAQLWLS